MGPTGLLEQHVQPARGVWAFEQVYTASRLQVDGTPCSTSRRWSAGRGGWTRSFLAACTFLAVAGSDTQLATARCVCHHTNESAV